MKNILAFLEKDPEALRKSITKRTQDGMTPVDVACRWDNTKALRAFVEVLNRSASHLIRPLLLSDSEEDPSVCVLYLVQSCQLSTEYSLIYFLGLAW